MLGFPAAVCTSINDVVCHGIPSARMMLRDGDIINVDVTTYLGEFHGDTSATTRGPGLRLRSGVAITIERMINLGRPDIVFDDDGWTVRTADGSLSAQFEHTVVVTADGCEITTLVDVLPS